MNPKCCRICSVIQSHHKSFIKNREKLGKTENLRAVYVILVALMKSEELGLHSDLQYKEKRNEDYISMRMVAIDSEYP